MSWIKDNQFIVTLGGITLGVAAALIAVGLHGSSKYKAATASYEETSSKAGESESLPLYPTRANLDGKRKALSEYRDAVSGLQNSFGKFHPETSPNIAPQEFTNRLKTANTEVIEALQAGKATVPEAFFSGFETYTGALARENATGLLDYQLGAAKELLLDLAKSSPSQLINFHRPRLPEEDGTARVPVPNEVARPLAFEISFKGTENSVRKFFSAIAKSENYFYVVRTVRISNEKLTPPLAADGKFEVIDPAGSDAASPSAPYTLPSSGDSSPLPEADAAAPAAVPPAAAESKGAPGRILSQVLGKEEIQVFARIDVLQFLAAKELPQP